MKVLIVITNVERTKRSGLATGFHFAEFSHAYEFFIDHGYDVTVASPNGGKCTITSDYPGDKINAAFKANESRMRLIEQTRCIADIKEEDFDAVYVAGGHGAMFDLAYNPDLASVINLCYESNGVVASVCHGPAGLIGVETADGEFLVQDKRVTSFTNKEEKATDFYDEMPFLLETELTKQGAIFEQSDPRTPHLTIASRIVTGQNPESIELVLGAIHAQLVTQPVEILAQ